MAREALRRLRCQKSLHSFELNVRIPTVAKEPMCPDEDLLGPAENFMASHHSAISHVVQRTILRPMGRAIIMAPPGSAKSLKVVAGVSWAMGKFPGHRYIYTSYADELAEAQSRRAQLLVNQPEYSLIWPGNPTMTKDAVSSWALSNQAEFLAGGLLSGLTGHRANGWVMDDPIKGRKEADSEVTRQAVYNAYKDDLLTRCLPGAWGIIILTRWHEDDPAGRILPADYDGGSGMYEGTDGLMWEVLNIPAKCERKDDPLGRRVGEYIWPEFYPPEHWAMFEHAKGREAQRTWSSLYQQRPTPQGAGVFHESMFHWHKSMKEFPLRMAYIGASDHAVTENGNDFSEAGVLGIDERRELWIVDWWHDQVDAGKAANKVLDMATKWKCRMWFNEGGVIDKAMRPLFNVLMRSRAELGSPAYVDIRAVPSMQDKVAKCSSFQGRAAAGGEKTDGSGEWNPGVVHLLDTADNRRIVAQLCALPAGRFDDAADVCGLFGRALDQFPNVWAIPEPEEGNIKPFTAQWLEYEEKSKPKVRWR